MKWKKLFDCVFSISRKKSVFNTTFLIMSKTEKSKHSLESKLYVEVPWELAQIDCKMSLKNARQAEQ